MPELTYVNASCHCALNTFRVGFLISSLPISTDLCHCSTCRHTSGQLAVEQVSIHGAPLARAVGGSRQHSGNRSRSRSPAPGARSTGNTNLNTKRHSALLAPPTIPIIVVEPDIPLDLTDLTAYKTSPDVTRYFCNSCSSHLFFVVHTKSTDPITGEEEKTDKWAVAVGALDKTEGIVRLGYHIWVGDTLDGGIANHLRRIEGVGVLPRYSEGVGSPLVPIGLNAIQPPPIANGSANPNSPPSSDLLKAFCHCGALHFALTRPTPESSLPTSVYPDLICPYDVSHLSKIHNPSDEKWWLAPRHSMGPKTKYLAGHCMCTFCRLTSGFEVQSWAFVPLVNVLVPASASGENGGGQDGEEWVPLCLEEDEHRPKALKQYISSPGRYREFCGTCGATAFWWQLAVPDLLEVSVGLLDERIDGARAESWLEWCTDRVSYEDKALSPEVAKALAEGLKESAKKAES
ncbi:unnamed protein product [Cyclocybe aegerita]|uniref:CENP-V/GFA domain-containing protein n=1 Tax=Cyclocybe aegerita TaxID=1973307 RepID=A0A8S0WP69_CYCAE|nr:unnamed protein product [Cyclocybe aegerita]